MSSNGYKELTAWKDRHTTGKSIYITGVAYAVPECSFRCGFSDASWFGCGGYQGDDGNADAQHHNTITPQDRDTRSSSASLAVAVIPFLTTALFTAGRHCDDFML